MTDLRNLSRFREQTGQRVCYQISEIFLLNEKCKMINIYNKGVN